MLALARVVASCVLFLLTQSTSAFVVSRPSVWGAKTVTLSSSSFSSSSRSPRMMTPNDVLERAETTVNTNVVNPAKSASVVNQVNDTNQVFLMPELELDSNKKDVEITKVEENLSETQKLMKKVKDAGVAGVISYAFWEVGFWAISVPVVLFGYREVTGHWPDLSDKEDLAKLGAEAFAFVNFARFAVPLRIGLALSTTPWIQANIVDRFLAGNNKEDQKRQ